MSYISFAILISLLAPVSQPDLPIRPVDPWDVLSKPDTLDIVSILPLGESKSGTTFHGYGELGRTRLANPAQREKIMRSMAAWVNVINADEDIMMCWAPRHGIHAVRDGVSVDVIICFECKSYRIKVTHSKETTAAAKDTKALLNSVLVDADVSLAPEAPETAAQSTNDKATPAGKLFE